MSLSLKNNQVSTDAKESTASEKANKRRSAGFWSVVFMVIGIQFAGMPTGWNAGVKEGMGEMLLANFFIGIMYILLSMCFAELVSIVPFAGGSFGYCRASLGPFWGFMVGASEMLENFFYVVITVMGIGSSCSILFGTDRSLEPLWYLLCYVLMYGIHLRGGLLLWYSVIACGLFTAVLIVFYCIGSMRDISVVHYGMPDGTLFHNDANHFMKAMFYPTWFYIGIEIVPQTCDRVKDVNTNLPRGLVASVIFSFAISFWLMMATMCNSPGVGTALSSETFPLNYDFIKQIHIPASFSAVLAIIPCFSAAVAFMWGCGYQVASLARSGLLPSIFAKTYGENETPYLTMAISSFCQFILCVILWAGAPLEGPLVLYETVMIGASIVYGGVFCAFIVFRTRFGAMKRHWVSAAGIPGAVVGMAIAFLVFVAVAAFQNSGNALIIYFLYMLFASLYYTFYAQRTQFFSAEEQKKFMKAYILNANKKNRKKAKSSYMKMFEKVTRLFDPTSIISGSVSKLSESSAQSGHSGASSNNSRNSKADNQSVSMTLKNNAVTPSAITTSTPVSSSNNEDIELGALSSSSAALATVTEENLHSHNVSSAKKGKDEVRGPQETKASTKGGHAQQQTIRNAGTRSSWASHGSMKLGWSGKMMTMNESKKFLEVLSSEGSNIAEKLAAELPGQFVMVPENAPASANFRDLEQSLGSDHDGDDHHNVVPEENVAHHV